MGDEPKEPKKVEKKEEEPKHEFAEFDWDAAFKQNERKIALPPPEECGQEP